MVKAINADVPPTCLHDSGLAFSSILGSNAVESSQTIDLDSERVGPQESKQVPQGMSIENSKWLTKGQGLVRPSPAYTGGTSSDFL